MSSRYILAPATAGEHDDCSWVIVEVRRHDIELIKAAREHMNAWVKKHGGWASMRVQGHANMEFLTGLPDYFYDSYDSLVNQLDAGTGRDCCVVLPPKFDYDAFWHAVQDEDLRWRSDCEAWLVYNDEDVLQEQDNPGGWGPARVYTRALNKYDSAEAEATADLSGVLADVETWMGEQI